MASLLISGGRPLCGEIKIQGSKNAVLPLMAAALLLPGTTRLSGCPRISDVAAMAELLEQVGARVSWEEDTLCIDAATVHPIPLKQEDTRKTRASILLLGALLGRTQCCEMAYPGGCAIGSRPIDLHLKALRGMGYTVWEREELFCEGKGVAGADIYFTFPSVGATQNALLTAATIPGETRLHGVAREPEVQVLCRFLQKAGVRIDGIGTKNLKIKGSEVLMPVNEVVPSDRIVAGTYLVAVLAAGGNALLHCDCVRELAALVKPLRAAGAKIFELPEGIRVGAGERLTALDYLVTEPYPGFPTDMQSQVMALAAVCEGTTILEERVFEARLATAAQLKRMGAKIYLEENRAIIQGVSRLRGAAVEAGDLRGAAALVIGGLSAEGETLLAGYSYILRGYEDIVRDFTALGAELRLTESR